MAYNHKNTKYWECE